MLSGVKFIARHKVEDEICEEKRKKSRDGKDKRRKKKKKKTYCSSSSDDEIERIRRDRRKKKWYSSDEPSTSDSSSSESEHEDGLNYKKDRKRKASDRDDDGGSPTFKGKDVIRREMGLEWMLKSAQEKDTKPTSPIESEQKEILSKEVKKVNPKELNPYLKDNGSGYPEDGGEKGSGGDQLLSTSLVGDGGASWRLKALKRAKEQAAREGRRFEEVVEERWGSLGNLAVSAASHKAAPSRAHLHAIKIRKNGVTEEDDPVSENQNKRHTEKGGGREYLRDVSLHHPKMRAPKSSASLSWGKRKGQTLQSDEGLVSAAASSLNKFASDGTFLQKVLAKHDDRSNGLVSSDVNAKGIVECKETEISREDNILAEEALSANQLAAKAMQLRMKGKHEEAQNLLQRIEGMKEKQATGGDPSRQQDVQSTRRYAVQEFSGRKRDDDDADRHLAKTIMANKKFSLSSQADDEYDFDGPAARKSRKKGSGSGHNVTENDNRVRRILTQQERCIFCFENPSRPKHLVVSIANFTYLMLPQRRPVVPGHCCILPLQHEAATRSVDDNVWEEIRNFKKCLIMMFAKQEKEPVFMETVMGLAQQRRHCLIECVPLPHEVAKQAPLYFKKAIDEAEDEWSQHNAKKLIDTSHKGLRNSIPKNFPYFHVEFGLNRGFVHVIDDEKQFKNSLGLNVIRGMLQLPEEDMHRRRRHESVEAQRRAVADFAREWEPFDWTKQLE